jgi:hypothetical protein
VRVNHVPVRKTRLKSQNHNWIIKEAKSFMGGMKK